MRECGTTLALVDIKVSSFSFTDHRWGGLGRVGWRASKADIALGRQTNTLDPLVLLYSRVYSVCGALSSCLILYYSVHQFVIFCLTLYMYCC